MKVTLHSIFFISLLLFGLSAAGQKKFDYHQTLYKIDSLAVNHMPKEALKLAQKVSDRAREDGNTTMLLKSLMYRVIFQNHLEANTQPKLIETIFQDLTASKQPEKSILQSLLAESYWQYYLQNSYRIRQRTTVNADIGRDITTWSIGKLSNEIMNLFIASISEKEMLQSTQIDVIERVLVGDTTTRYLRPTLYDLLAFRALNILTNTGANLSRPVPDEVSVHPQLFSDAQTFAATKFSSADSTSFSVAALKIYQELLKMHKHSGHLAAFADADLRRLRFAYQLSRTENSAQEFFNGLQRALAFAENTDIYTDILYEQAKLYQYNLIKPRGKNNLINAMALIQKAISKRPNSPGAQNALKMAEGIQGAELQISIKDQIVPNKPALLVLTYKNIAFSHFRLYKIKSGDSRAQSFSHNKASYFAFLAKEKFIKEWTTQLPAYKDYHSHKFADHLEGLPIGKYLLIAQDRDLTDTLTEDLASSFATFNVTEMGLIYRGNGYNDRQYVVANSWDGKPLSGVKIQEYVNRIGSNYLTIEQPGSILVTDERGLAFSDSARHVSAAVLTRGADTLRLNTYHPDYSYNNKVKKRVVLFTDRPIYRPGQMVFYKGLLIESEDQKNKILPDQSVPVTIVDVNGQRMENKNFTTNDFGTFEGSFSIPLGKLNGNMQIRTPYGEVSFQVEEYKRPRFEVKFDDPKERYKLGDSITVKGEATSFSGYQIGRALVNYTVYRLNKDGYDNYRSDNFLVAKGNANTDSEGKFSIKFFPSKDAENQESDSEFQIKVEVTDLSGETRVAERNITAGHKDIKILTGLPEFMYLGNNIDTVRTLVQNLNGQPIKANLKVEWFELQAPDRLTHDGDIQHVVEDYGLSREEFIAKFPHLQYKEENRPSNWKVVPNAAFSKSLTADSGSVKLLLTKKELKPGYYKVLFSAYNADKDTVKAEGIIRIYDTAPDNILTSSEWLKAEKYIIKPNEQAIFRIAGITSGVKAYYEVYYKDETVERSWIEVSPKQTLVKITPKAHYEKSFAVQFSMVQNGMIYSQLQTISIQDDSKELEVKFLSFRDKLQPGEQEKWKLRITNKAGQKQMAEMVATLYDASLDVLKKMDWNQIYAGYNYGSYTWNTNLGIYNSGNRLWFLYRPKGQHGTYVREYEALTSFLLPYGDGKWGIYNRYLNTADRNLATRDSLMASTKLAALRKGGKLYGVVRDEFGFVIPDAVVTAGNGASSTTDRYGIYEITAKGGQTIAVAAAGYRPYLVKLKLGQTRLDITVRGSTNRNLQEVVIRGYQKRTRSQTTGSSIIVEAQSAPGMRGSIKIRGNNTISNMDELLQGRVAGLSLEETVVSSFEAMEGYDSKTGKYIINGKVVKGLAKVSTRTNFDETAFFYPQLRTNEAGEIEIEFTIPQSLTRYKMMGFVHTKEMLNTVVSADLITQKQFSITANAPRFFREGDTIFLSATLQNLSGKKLKGYAALQLSDALSGKITQLILPGSGVSAGQEVKLANKDSQVLKWPLVIPSGISAITYKVVAQSGKYSDGEEMTVPVLPNSMLVTETMPLNVRGNSTKTFIIDKLLQSASSPTLRHQSYTLEFTSNPVWYAIQSLPYLMEYPYECAEQTFSRFYANSFATAILNSSHKISEVFKQWQENEGGKEMLSNLEKNQELKSILLEETPWVRNATNESERKKRLGVLFDLDKMSSELKRNFDKLEQMQFPNGSFPWFNGMQEDRYITQHIMLGMSQLRHLKVVDENSYPNFNVMLNRAIIYLDRKFSEDYILTKEGKRTNYLPLHYLYARSYTRQLNTEKTFITAFNQYITRLKNDWGLMSLYEQGLAALVLHRNGNTKEALMIVKSLKDRAQSSEEMGMFWTENTDGWWWYQRSVETQALMVEVFDEVANDSYAVEELKIWLLKNKQTTDWKTTKATTAACYALLMRGYNLLDESAEPELLIGDKTFAQLGIAEPEKEAGTGYRKISVEGSMVKPEMAKVSIKNNNKGIAWGGIYWQYFEQLDKLTPAETGIKIKKQLFLQEQTSTGLVLHPLTPTRNLKSGDLLKVRIEIYSDRDMEYLHLKDMRSSGFEPVNVISTYKYQDGLGYYESTKDATTNFFINYMRKGTYVFEYPLRVSHAGNFSNGITTLQSMYAPEFSTHSEGIRTVVKP